MKECKNCGMPLVKNEDFGNNDPKSALCKHCFCDKSVSIGAKKDGGDANSKLTGVNDLGNLEKMDIF